MGSEVWQLCSKNKQWGTLRASSSIFTNYDGWESWDSSESQFEINTIFNVEDLGGFVSVVNDGSGDADVRCRIKGCHVPLSRRSSANSHKIAVHSFQCLDCHKCCPTEHMLDIHIMENHDPIFAVKFEKEPSFHCLVEGCEVRFMTPQDRNKHAKDDHHYPKDFRFMPLNVPPQPENPDVKMEEELEDPQTKTFPPKPKVPNRIVFGRGKTRGFWRGSSKPRGKGRGVDMKDLSEALPDIEKASKSS